jgi:hypothetical protein
MQSRQLELNFSCLLANAKAAPLITDWQQLCLSFDAAMQTRGLDDISASERLAIAADAIVEMTEVFYQRASQYLSFSTNTAGEIIFEEDFFDQFLAEQPTFDPAKYLKDEPLYQRSKVATISKEKALEFAYEPELPLTETEVGEAIVALEYDEDVSGWTNQIFKWLKDKKRTSAALVEMEQCIGLTMVQLLLAGLLEQDVLEIQLGEGREFYEREGVALGLAAEILVNSGGF